LSRRDRHHISGVKFRNRTVILALSFGQRRSEPNPCNLVIAQVALLLSRDSASQRLPVIAQWEVARAMELQGTSADVVINQPEDGSYLSTIGVLSQTSPHISSLGAREIIVVAHPFLHQRYVAHLVSARGLTPYCPPMPKVGYDRSALNQQWWTKGRARLIAYAIRLGAMGLLRRWTQSG